MSARSRERARLVAELRDTAVLQRLAGIGLVHSAAQSPALRWIDRAAGTVLAFARPFIGSRDRAAAVSLPPASPTRRYGLYALLAARIALRLWLMRASARRSVLGLRGGFPMTAVARSVLNATDGLSAAPRRT